ncbi:hypothetical protein GCM10011588_70840 [Nocardia jinanensis]|uniref:Pentapeptide repeat-containing protein n=1 Tax=Nocardia jinanensis TaxID=382504 RepID=A0A917RZX9_9NOCA|nr:hypothetical protein GCM10011588_70840 [Nocardia jinanensis]
MSNNQSTRGARTHNPAGLDLDIPRHRLVVFVGYVRLIGTDLYTAWLTAADISRADLSDADLRKV